MVSNSRTPKSNSAKSAFEEIFSCPAAEVWTKKSKAQKNSNLNVLFCSLDVFFMFLLFICFCGKDNVSLQTSGRMWRENRIFAFGINRNTMKVINFAETNSVINQYVAEIRDVNIQGDRMRFRRNIERIGELMAYEMSKELTYSVKQVQTPLGVAPASTPDDQVVIATVFRAGLPLHQGFLNVFDRAGNAFVSAYRYYKDKECRELDVHIEYIAAPDLSQKTVMLVDPMLATGESMELAYRAFLSKGRPARLLIACVIASRQGVEHLQRIFPDDDVVLWCAAIDPELNERSYIVPGLGDAGDLAYGDKL